MEEDSMKKLLVTTAVLFAALPFTFNGVTPAVSKAHAMIGRPLTPLSVAGVHRRAMRRTYGIGANLGYRRYGYHPVARAALYGARFGYGYHPCALTLSCSPWTTPGLFLDPVARVALYGGWGGWGGWGWRHPIYASAALGWGGGWGGWGWRRSWYWSS
jgi:hypothetical protein